MTIGSIPMPPPGYQPPPRGPLGRPRVPPPAPSGPRSRRRARWWPWRCAAVVTGCWPKRLGAVCSMRRAVRNNGPATCARIVGKCSGAMRKSSLLGTVLCVAWVMSAPAAHADPISDRAFLNDLQAHGMEFDGSDDQLVALGHAVCADLDHGLTYQQVEQKLMVSAPGWTPNTANGFAWTAVSDLCPTRKPPIATPKPGGPGLDPNWPTAPGH